MQRHHTAFAIGLSTLLGLTLVPGVLGHPGEGVHPEHPEHTSTDADATSQPEGRRPGNRQRPAQEAEELPAPEVTIEIVGVKRVITANGVPNHTTGAFPNRRNPNAIASQTHRYEIPLEPKAAGKPTEMRMHPFGIGVNGIPFDPGAAEFWNNDRDWQYEPMAGGVDLGIDQSNAHVQPTGAYHYHALPHGLIEEVRKTKPAGQETMLLVGWAADGFPMYAPFAHEDANDPGSPLVEMKSSYRVREGDRPGGGDGPGGTYDGTFVADYEYVEGAGDLDECNGRTGVTPEFPDGTYHYVLTEEFPFIPRLFRGEPDESFMRRGRPGGPGQRPSMGRPPRGPGGPGQGRPPRPPRPGQLPR